MSGLLPIRIGLIVSPPTHKSDGVVGNLSGYAQSSDHAALSEAALVAALRRNDIETLPHRRHYVRIWRQRRLWRMTTAIARKPSPNLLHLTADLVAPSRRLKLAVRRTAPTS